VPEDLNEGVLQHIICVIMVEHDVSDVAVQRPLVIRQQLLKRLVLRFRVEQQPYEILFFQRNFLG
jgi:hypothetical protein